MSRYATRNPTTGETTIGMRTLSTTPVHFTIPTAARVAPIRPPMSAWDDDEGSPNHQVMRFQAIAPSSAARTTTRLASASGSSTIPDPTVSPTPVPRNAPSRFIAAARTTAARGVSARVDTDVAIALAASWKPFV